MVCRKMQNVWRKHEQDWFVEKCKMYEENMSDWGIANDGICLYMKLEEQFKKEQLQYWVKKKTRVDEKEHMPETRRTSKKQSSP